MRPISAVINARLSSTRVPKKLMRPFAGTTLIEIALEKLNNLSFFENRYLAVADPELIELGQRYANVDVLLRKPESIRAGVNDPSVSFAHYLDIPTEYIFIVNPCQPLLTEAAIRKAYDYFQNTDFDSYTAVVPSRDWIFDDAGGCLTRKDPRNYSTNTGQVFMKASHSFHIVGKSFFKVNGYHWTFLADDPHLIEVDENEIIDVDSENDFKLAEYAYSMKMESAK